MEAQDCSGQTIVLRINEKTSLMETRLTLSSRGTGRSFSGWLGKPRLEVLRLFGMLELKGPLKITSL